MTKTNDIKNLTLASLIKEPTFVDMPKNTKRFADEQMRLNEERAKNKLSNVADAAEISAAIMNVYANDKSRFVTLSTTKLCKEITMELADKTKSA